MCIYTIAIERQRLESAYGRAIAALREARSGLVAVEQRRNFGGRRRSPPAFTQTKRSKLSSWVHKFYCLSETEDDIAPSSVIKGMN